VAHTDWFASTALDFCKRLYELFLCVRLVVGRLFRVVTISCGCFIGCRDGVLEFVFEVYMRATGGSRGRFGWRRDEGVDRFALREVL